MAVKRIKSEAIKIKNLKKFKGKDFKSLSKEDKEELLEIVAKKLNIL